MSNWLSLIVPAIVAILIVLIPAVLRLSNRLALADERIQRLSAELDEEKRRNDQQDTRLGGTDVALARIESKLDLLLQKLQQVHIP